MTDVKAFSPRDIAVEAEGVADRFDVEIFRDVDAIDADWAALESDAVLTPFQTRAWLIPFYRELAPRLKATPVLVLVRDGMSGRPLMLLPLCARRYYGVMVVQFADLGVSDYNAPIIAKSFNPSAAEWHLLFRKIVTSIRIGSILRFKNLPRQIGGRPNLLVQHGKNSVEMELAAWGLNLPLSIDDYTKRVLRPSFAKELAKKRRRTARRGDIEFVVAETATDRQTAFDLLMRQRQERCDEMGRINVLAQESYRRFYQAATVETDQSLSRLVLFKVGGEAVGTVFALQHQDGFHVVISTFEGGEWKTCSLGNLVLQSAVEHCINSNIGYFDLTIGNEDYKQDFGATPVPLFSTLQPLTPLGAVLTFGVAAATKINKAFMRMPSFWSKAKFRLSTE